MLLKKHVCSNDHLDLVMHEGCHACGRGYRARGCMTFSTNHLTWLACKEDDHLSHDHTTVPYEFPVSNNNNVRIHNYKSRHHDLSPKGEVKDDIKVICPLKVICSIQSCVYPELVMIYTYGIRRLHTYRLVTNIHMMHTVCSQCCACLL